MYTKDRDSAGTDKNVPH